ncbi:MAG TPA: GNAT family N-acetyltransferase [Tepidisphaeraceae bacterium]|jgi:predicted GNAT family acetyltransferase|nr:GNAT family N-acetyltransferase [Tepidisphaeraceae bacterium]
MTDFAPLDNPIWHALATAHRALARSHGRAARYPGDVSPLAGLAEPTPSAFADMAKLVGPEESVALFARQSPDVPAEWEVKRSRWIHQMTCAEPPESPALPIAKLTPADVPEMLALTALAQPGPFLPRTIAMGSYFGIRAADGRLAAMAGERLCLDDFVEISAVCTHPDFRGRGHGRAMVAFVAARSFRMNKTPFLHVVPENPAIHVYEKVGLSVRCDMCLTIIAPR